MIRYSLVCDNGHGFEGWFSDSAAYEAQADRGLLACALCGSGKVGKAIMAPAITRRGREENPAITLREREPAAPAAMSSSNTGEAQPMALMDGEAVRLRAAIKALRDHVEANAENVGPAFAETAREMHDGVIDHKPIYGVATPEEVAELRQDGIEAWPLPVLPGDRN